MSDNFALRESLAYEIKRWRPAKTFTEARADADTVIAAIELPTPGVLPITHHPLVKFVADKFIVDWPAASAALTGVVQILMPDLTLTVGVNGGGTRHGYRRSNYGSVTPDLLLNGDEIRVLRTRIANEDLFFTVEGSHPQNEFTSMEIVGEGILLSANADVFDDTGLETTWRWNGSGITLDLATVYAVDFK